MKHFSAKLHCDDLNIHKLGRVVKGCLFEGVVKRGF